MRALGLSFVLSLPATLSAAAPPAGPPPAPALRGEALAALRKAAAFYHGKASSHGGYVYYFTPDLKQRWGEGKANEDTLFVQPPGTPTVGMAFLAAYEATGEKAYLDAARDAALALVAGQLQSGGWTQTIHFGPAKRLGKYRSGKGGNWNVSSLDDGQTQAALKLLMRFDAATNSRDEKVHEAAGYGLAALLKAQFPNGGFPQVWAKPVEAKAVKKASYPGFDWRTEGKLKNYWDHYTLNDGLAGTVCDVLIEAHRTYGDAKYMKSLTKLGDFLILAQMPSPQPGWCQQYDDEMRPTWARKFEPPAVTGWESQDAMEALIRIARYTGERKYLEPIPRALKYFEASLLKGGRVARFYELKTNAPLYFDAGYRLTYDDSAAPKHYGFSQPARFGAIRKAYRDALAVAPPARPRTPGEMAEEVRRIAGGLDGEGRWVSVYRGERLVGQPKFAEGFRYLSSEVFARHVEVLSEYVAATR